MPNSELRAMLQIVVQDAVKPVNEGLRQINGRLDRLEQGQGELRREIEGLKLGQQLLKNGQAKLEKGQGAIRKDIAELRSQVAAAFQDILMLDERTSHLRQTR